jgi:uncharacterized protein (TIGR04255 family)
MAKPRHLTRAPITEAVIDLRCRLDSGFDLSQFQALQSAIGYGDPVGINLFEFGMLQQPGKYPEGCQVNHGIIGWRFTSGDEKNIVQFRKDGFTFSRLAPYTHWDEIFAEASRLYRLYVKIAEPEEVSRPAVRFINRLLFPEAEVGDFSPFLTAPPIFPHRDKAFVTGFLNQIQVHDPDYLICATITQMVQNGAAEPGQVPVILDLDVYEARSYSPMPEVVLPRFAALRQAKNKYFFESITERAVELFI